MGLARSRGKHLESAISICILATLVIIGVGICLKQSDYDMSRFGIDSPAVPKLETPSSKSEIPFELSSIIPAGFEMFSKTEIYTSDNLFEKINGKAPLYTESGFLRLFTQRFAAKDDQNKLAELYIYDMDAAKNAFSVYSTQKRADTEDLSDFVFAYKTKNAIYLAHGKYYIELIGFSESPRLFEAMVKIIRKINAVLGVNNDSGIAELALFPKENLVPGSSKLFLTGTFGFEKLTDTFTTRYKIDNETVTAFLSKRPSRQDAQKLADDYHNFLIRNGGVAKPAINKTIKAKAIDFYGSIEIISATGPFVFGAHEAENQQSAERLAAKLANTLNRAKALK